MGRFYLQHGDKEWKQCPGPLRLEAKGDPISCFVPCELTFQSNV